MSQSNVCIVQDSIFFFFLFISYPMDASSLIKYFQIIFSIGSIALVLIPCTQTHPILGVKFVIP